MTLYPEKDVSLLDQIQPEVDTSMLPGVPGQRGPQGPTGATGPQGPSGVTSVTSPITNTGTSTSANIGINQSALQITESQVTNLVTHLAAKETPAGAQSKADTAQAAAISAAATDATTKANTAQSAAISSANSYTDTVASAKAPINNPTFTGIPSAPTATSGTNTTQIATTQFVSTAVANLISSAPTALDTLNELATALGNDANFATTVTNSLAGKAASSHTHPVSDVTNLQTSLDGKAASSHTHAIGDVTSLQTSLDGKAASSHTHSISDVTSLQTSLDGKAASSHTHAISDVTGLQTSLDGKVSSVGVTAPITTTGGTTPTIGFSGLLQPATGTVIPLTIQQASGGQTANLLELKNAAGTGIIASLDKDGNLRTPAVINPTTYNNSRLQMLTSGVLIDTQIATNLPLAVRGATSQSENMQVWQTWNGTSASTAARVSGNGSIATSNNLAVGQTGITNGNQFQVSTTSATQVGAVIKGYTTQTADLLQVYKLSGDATPVTKVDSSGVLTSTGLTLSSTTSPITLNALVGTSGQVLASGGAGATPTWVDRMSNPMTTAGDIIYGGASGAATRLAGSTTNNWVLTYDTSTNAPKWAAAASGFSGGTLTGALVLAPGNGSPNTNLYPLTFQTNTATPAANSGSMDYDGTVFYQTSNTNPGRALATQSYYYVSNGTYSLDFSGSATAQSILGGTTTGISLAAGTTYEFELYTAIQYQNFGDSTTTVTYNLTSSTVSGSPTLAYTQLIDYANNTTAFTTAASISSIRSSNATGLTIAAVTTGSRYYIIKVRGTIRVTGTGSAKIYPSLTASATTVNIPTVQTGTMFKLTPIGNGTVTTIGTWA